MDLEMKQSSEVTEQKPTATRSNPKSRKDNVNKILIANVGANPYIQTRYIDENRNELTTTGYTFDAVVKLENPNKLILVGTRKSFWDSLVEWYAEIDQGKSSNKEDILGLVHKEEVIEELSAPKDNSQNTRESMPRKRPVYKPISIDEEGLSRVEKYIASVGGFEQVRIVLVSNGVSRDEQEQYFQLLRDAIESVTVYGDTSETPDEEAAGEDKKTEIIFDVSNGFRSMPLYIMMLVRYYDLLYGHGFEFKAYYGNFDVRGEYGGKAPLVNLSIVPIMTDWINALHEFIEFGNVKTLIKCLEKERGGKSEENVRYIDEVIKEFNALEYAMNANNLYYFKQAIVYITGFKYLSFDHADYEVLNVEHPAFSVQAQMMLENIRTDYQSRFGLDEKYRGKCSTIEAYVLEKIAEMYISQGNYGDAAIAFQEGVLTYIMEQFLKDRIVKVGGYTTDQEFYEIAHDFKRRDNIKQLYIDELNAHKSDINANGNGTKKSKREQNEFDIQYENVKDRIRNTQAHFKYEKTEDVFVGDMENWLSTGVRMLLEEMLSGNYKEVSFTNLTGLLEVYQEDDSTTALKDARSAFFKGILSKGSDVKNELTRRIREKVLTGELDDSLMTLHITRASVERWCHELVSYEENSNDPSDLIKNTYLAWVDKKKQKEAGLAVVEYDVEHYLRRVREVDDMKIKIIESLKG